MTSRFAFAAVADGGMGVTHVIAITEKRTIKVPVQPIERRWPGLEAVNHVTNESKKVGPRKHLQGGTSADIASGYRTVL